MSVLAGRFRAAPATVVLAGACVAVFVLEVVLARTGHGALISGWALSGTALAEGRWWTLVTHLFVHGSLLHLLVNVLALWFIGPEVEFMLGRVRYVVLYVLSGIAGGLLQTAFSQPASELIGSSGAVCGVLLSFTTAYPEMPLRALLFFILPVSMKAKTLGRSLIAVSLIGAVTGVLPWIGHLAHLGGALAGAFLTWWWLPPEGAKPLALIQAPSARREAVLRRLMEEGIEALSREERRELEKIAEKRPRER